ncbi:MAG: hypothetical protein J7K66_00705 [Anaerolineaceae bacterium]|nr:hypothetical protein [Anaerolineaceae bacterium]
MAEPESKPSLSAWLGQIPLSWIGVLYHSGGIDCHGARLEMDGQTVIWGQL